MMTPTRIARARRPMLFVALAALAAVVPLGAQVLRGGDLVVPDFGPAALWRITPSGAVSQIPSSLLVGPAGAVVTRTRDIVVADFNGNSLVRIDQAGNSTIIAQNLGGPLRVAEDKNGDLLVTSNSQKAVLRVNPATGAVSTVHAGPPMNRPFDVALDPNGDILVSDDLGRGLYRIPPGGVPQPIHTGAPFRLPQGAAVFPNGDYAVFDGLTDSVFRIDRATSQVSTWVPNSTLVGNPEGIVESDDGGFYVSQSGNPVTQVVHIDAAGNVTPVATGAPLGNLEDVNKMPALAGPNGLRTGAGSIYAFDLDEPAFGNRFYSVVLSGSVHPGFQIPADPRALTVNPDSLFFATLFQSAAPVLLGFTGMTDASGRAALTMDLSFLPPGILAGRTLYLQGIVVSPGSPRGIGAITNVLPLDFK